MPFSIIPIISDFAFQVRAGVPLMRGLCPLISPAAPGLVAFAQLKSRKYPASAGRGDPTAKLL